MEVDWRASQSRLYSTVLPVVECQVIPVIPCTLPQLLCPLQQRGEFCTGFLGLSGPTVEKLVPWVWACYKFAIAEVMLLYLYFYRQFFVYLLLWSAELISLFLWKAAPPNGWYLSPWQPHEHWLIVIMLYAVLRNVNIDDHQHHCLDRQQEQTSV